MNSSEYIIALKSTFYAVPPQETYIEKLQETKSNQPLVLFLILVTVPLEGLHVHLRGNGKQWRLSVAMNNMLVGAFTIAWNLFFLRGLELLVYIWCYNNIRIAHLPWNSFYTYVIAVIGVDFCTYWWHRLSHEVAFLWAAHSTHHSGEDYNLSCGARISALVRLTKWMYFVPLGMLGVPPSIFAMHVQLNFACALWSHSLMTPNISKIIPGLGQLIEFIMVTPSNHRVHHGVNKYALDKNYGMLFIVWDRMFGTFTEEREDEPIVYGTVSQMDTFHTLGIQLKPYQQLYQKMKAMKTGGDRLRTLFYGPGWSPGKPRLGAEEDIPDIVRREQLEQSLPFWLNLYLAFQTAVVVFLVKDMGVRVETFGLWLSFVNFGIILSACISLGALHDSNYHAVWLEPLRLIIFMVASHLYPMLSSHLITTWVSAVCLGSLLFWPLLRDHLHSLHASSTSAQNGVVRNKTK
ncbi:alkylglycerol monooxygenase-like [Eriocheir sinensis]|uniref:alkylglycerol monooxygenase-like n=1 Tax=Eriocheir sinensis TaxID=95602 RepID=UPI0021C5D377|nr:alkylglycerol monooxygenase-like [Eriocheir sinensis]